MGPIALEVIPFFENSVDAFNIPLKEIFGVLVVH